MNKREIVTKYENTIYAIIATDEVLKDLKQLDEPQKTVVPQFVADYIDISKFYVRTLHYALESSPEKVKLWLCEDEKNRQEIFARAWLDGYDVEKEPKYTVKVKATKQYLSNDEIGIYFDPSFRSNFTKSDLEKLGLGWVFDCEGMEVEKVEG